jgi:tetratricopeptide (TPR) repeat protein
MDHSFRFNKAHWSKLWTGLPVTLMAMVLLVSGPVMADDALAAKTLKEQGRFWESKGRLDLAVPAWKLLLQIEPQNSEALASIAQFELSNNRHDAASAIIDELKKQPELNRDAIRRIENAATQQSINPKELDQARAAARAGKVNEAIGLYRQLLEGRSLTGPIALEYYQTLGGTTNGWDEARKGLKRLNADKPVNPAVELAYAQHLTYRAGTRREGIRLLADLARNPQVASPARNAWRQALIWLKASRNDTSLFRAYLNVQPNDDAIRARAASLNRVSTRKPLDARSIALRDGFSALNGGDVDVAEKRFESLLQKNPKNSDALGGLGVVRLKQERFADAENLLNDALRISKNRKWAEALNTSRFWLAMQDGQAKLEEKNLDLAKEAFQRAQKLDSKSPLPQVALIKALMLFDQVDEAQSLLGAMKNGPQRREASRELDKRKAVKAIQDKQFADAERLLMAQSGPLDAEAQELLAWAQYHQGKTAEAAKGFADAYRLSSNEGAAMGLVSSLHKQKSYQELLALIQQDTGPLRDLVPITVQQKIAQGENRFEQDSKGRLAEVDPVIILTDEVLWPATLALLKEKNPKKAYDLLLPVEDKLIEIGEYSMLNVLGKAATEVGDQATALRVLRKAAEGTEDETFYFMWAQSLIQFGRDEEAEQIMLKQLEYLDVDGLTILGWTQSRLGKPDQAAERFAAAYAKQPSEDSAKALVFAAYQAGNLQLILATLNKHPDGALDSLVTSEVRTQIATGEKKFGIDGNARLVVLQGQEGQEGLQGNDFKSGKSEFSLKFEPYLRSKSAAAGEGKLRQSSLVTTLSWQDDTQRASLELDRQSATDAIDRASGQRWYAKWGMRMASNIDFQVGVGRTLSGGAVRHATVGEAGVGYSTPEGGVGVRLFRRSNEESLLALSGTPDATTGIRWGRVLERGMALNAHHKGDRWDALGSLVVSHLEGQTVADNRKAELYGRALHPLDAVPGLSLGPEVYISHFSRNLSAFEPGHGGYFSPSRATTLGGMGRYETSLGTLALTFTGGLGWSYNREAVAAGNPITGARPGQYPAATGSGLAHHGRIEGLQSLGSHWVLGFGLGLQRSYGYSDRRANVFVQRRWDE